LNFEPASGSPEYRDWNTLNLIAISAQNAVISSLDDYVRLVRRKAILVSSSLCEPVGRENMAIDGHRVFGLLVTTMVMSCGHGLRPWQTGDKGMMVSLGKTNLGENVQVSCEVIHDGDRRTSAIKIVLRPACTPKNPLRVEIDVSSPRGDVFAIRQKFPHEFPPGTDWSEPEKAAQWLPLLFEPPSDASVWAKVEADCDDRNTHIEGAATCAMRK
jgi:hypothetical protein